MTEHNVQRVAIAGFGAIGKVVAEHLDRGIDGLSLAAVSARDTKRAEAAMAGFAHAAPVLSLARLGEFADIVVECAPAALLREIAEPALAAGRTVIVLSCGALVDNFDLVDLARRQGGRILVPTGALLALTAGGFWALIVTRVTADAVWLGGKQIRARTVLWAAGVAAAPLAQTLGAPLDRSGRVLVEPDLSIPGHPEAFAIGDMCAFLHQTGTPLPGTAPVAIQQGRAVADNVLRRLSGKPTRQFRYRDKGSMATIGRAAAVAVVGRLRLSGLVAWLAWLLVHITFLIGFRNRFLVLFEWAWAYVTWHRGARLITGPWKGRG